MIKKKDFNVRAWLAGNPNTYYEIDIKKDKKNSTPVTLGNIPDDSTDFDIYYWIEDRKTGEISNVKNETILVVNYTNALNPIDSIWIEKRPSAKAGRIIIDGGSPQPPHK